VVKVGEEQILEIFIIQCGYNYHV